MESAGVEVAFAFAPPTLPPLGYEHQFGLVEFRTGDECERNQPSVAAQIKCRAWVKEQIARREEIEASFRRVYDIHARGVQAGGRAIDGARVVATAAGDRVRLEATIPAEALSAAGQAPVRNVLARVAVEAGSTWASSSSAGDATAERWSATSLVPALHFGRHPVLLETAAKKQLPYGQSDTAIRYTPTRDAHVVEFLVNEPRGYQWEPEAPSPSLQSADLGAWKEIARLGDTRVVEIETCPGLGGVMRALATVRGDTIVELGPEREASVVAVVERPPGLHLLDLHEGPARYLGTGECGACPNIVFTVRRVDRAGRFVEPIVLDSDGGEKVIEAVTFLQGRLDAFGVRGTYVTADGPFTEMLFEARHAWDPRNGMYETRRKILGRKRY